MEKYINTQTYNNLKRAFEDEAAAHTRYALYSRVAEEEGQLDIADYFSRVANDKLGQAGIWLKDLDALGDTKQNLNYAVEGERANQEMLRKAASDADKEGFDELSGKFLLSLNVSKGHEANNRRYLDNMNNGQNPSTDTVFRCTNCGYEHRGLRAPERCPLCDYPKRYFRRFF